MARIPLLGGAYQSRGLIASAQRCVNLYPERNPKDSSPPVPVTHYPTPGLRKVSQAPIVGRVRATYRATNGDLYVVVNTAVYYVSPEYVWTSLGSIPAGPTPVSFSDNGLVIVLVNGTLGYAIHMVTRAFGAISDPIFYGAAKVDYLDTYFIFNRPDTAQFYISLSNVTFEMLTGTPGEIYQSSILAGGTGYTDGSYPALALSGGAGTGATANVTISGGIVTVATIVSGGSGYLIGDVLTNTSSTIGAGGILTGSITAPGSLYTNGSYTSVPLTGGSGTGALATVVVSGAEVTSVTITTKGNGYAPSNVLSASAASIGGTGSGFTYTVSTVASGFGLSVDGIRGSAFDALDIAAKTGSADDIVTIAAIHGELWLIGELTTEIWANTGAADFTFGRIQGAFVDHGCAAAYSLAQQDVFLFWLTQDRQGEAVIVKSAGYGVVRISTHAIEQDIQAYNRIDDAIGYCHQIEGHAFYVLTFPTEDKTWVYELATGQWHERGSVDSNGVLTRHRANAFAFAYGHGHVGDYQNGSLYVYDQNWYLDGEQPIPRVRTFPHVVGKGNRIEYTQFVADLEVGQTGGMLSSAPPMVSLRWSDTRGATYGNPVMQSMGATGQVFVSPQWRRLGSARDRVFELSWSAPVKTALNGAWIETEASET